jgi:hypothetical protein
MATSAEKDDRDEDEKDTAASDEEQAAEKKAAEPASKADKATGTDDDDDDDDDEDDEDEDEEEEEAKPAAKPPAASPAKGAVSAKPGAQKSAPVTAKRSAGPVRPGRSKPLPPRQRGSLGKTMILFVAIVGGLAATFVLLSREENSPPRWSPGQTVDMDVTLVPSDAFNLGCASSDVLAGKRCAFDPGGKPPANFDASNDATLLRPYTTTGGIQFFGAGLWSNPGLAPTLLPQDEARFTAHCKFKVDGSIKKAQVRWKTEGPWLDWAEPHYAGSLTDCKLVP